MACEAYVKGGLNGPCVVQRKKKTCIVTKGFPSNAPEEKSMIITDVESLHCDAGWRNFSFLKISTTDGIVGYSEYGYSETQAVRAGGPCVEPRDFVCHSLCNNSSSARRHKRPGNSSDRKRPFRYQRQGTRGALLRIIWRQNKG